MSNDTVDPANVGRNMRQEHGWAKSQAMLLRLYVEALFGAESWGQRAKFALWSIVYVLLAVVAVAVWAAVTTISLAWRGASWTVTQLVGLATSTRKYFTHFHFDDVLVPWIREIINFLIKMLPRAFGVRNATRKQQIDANVVLIGVTFFSGIFTGGAAWVLIFVWGALLLFAFFFRGTPAGESHWRRFRNWLPAKDDYNIPLWRSE